MSMAVHVGDSGGGWAEGVEGVEGSRGRDRAVTRSSTAALSTVTQHDRHREELDHYLSHTDGLCPRLHWEMTTSSLDHRLLRLKDADDVTVNVT